MNVKDKPTIGLDRLPPIFASCLGMAGERTKTVFEVGGHVYATNGKMVVRTPTPSGWDVPNPERVLASAGGVFHAEYEPDSLILPAVEVRDCAYCDGTRFRDVTPCPSCDGGLVPAPDCECPHCEGEHHCKSCDGTGDLPAGPCRCCMRTGVAGSGEGVEIAPGVWITCRELALLARHGADVYLPADRGPGWGRGDRDETGAKTIRLVVGGVEGRMMPLDARVCENDRQTIANPSPMSSFFGQLNTEATSHA